MRKLILQQQITLDGFNATGPNDEQKWVTWAWDEIKNYVLELARSCDTELIGRKLAIDYIPYWEETLLQPDSMMHEVAQVKARQSKIVFTKTLTQTSWQNTTLESGDLKQTILKLKEQEGKNIVVYGGSEFVANLIKEQLIDEFYFYINPIAIGKGISIFDRLENWQQLKLVETVTFLSGIVLMHYQIGK